MKLQPVKASQIPTEQAIFSKGWEMLKTYYSLEQNSKEEDWEALVNEAQQLYRLGNTKPTEALSKAIALGVLEYIELLSKERKQP